MLRALAVLAGMLFVPLAAGAEFRLEPSFIDSSQAGALRASAALSCRQIHRDHGAKHSPDDCVMIDPRTMEVRLGPEGDPDSWTQHLGWLWCEGNRYTGTEHRFQLRTGSSCQQVCERSEEDVACLTKADIGRAARREPLAWTTIGEFRLLQRPRKRALRCTGDQEHAEVWRVEMLALKVAPGVRRPEFIRFRDDGPMQVTIVCPDGVESPKRARFRALVASGDTCLPWGEGEVGAPCLHRPERIAE